MINMTDKVAVCSRSFSKHPLLRAELLSRYSHVTFNETGCQLAGDDLIKFLKGHNKAITALEMIDNHTLSSLPELAVIGKYGVGLDMIDLDAMRFHGKRLGWTGGVNKRSVSELTIAFAIMLLRRVIEGNREILDGGWRQLTGGLLSGRVIGIIGCGHVGKDLVKMLVPFGCKILAHDILEYPDFYSKYSVESVSKRELLSRSDVVTLHVPFDVTTKDMINSECLGLMKSRAILINVARGGLVDELALKKALIENNIGGAAFDVFTQEPPQDDELLALTNFISTPHIGGSSEEAIVAMGLAAIEGLEKNAVP